MSTADRVRQLRRQGLSPRAIGAALGVSLTVVLAALQESSL